MGDGTQHGWWEEEDRSFGGGSGSGGGGGGGDGDVRLPVHPVFTGGVASEDGHDVRGCSSFLRSKACARMCTRWGLLLALNSTMFVQWRPL